MSLVAHSPVGLESNGTQKQKQTHSDHKTNHKTNTENEKYTGTIKKTIEMQKKQNKEICNSLNNIFDQLIVAKTSNSTLTTTTPITSVSNAHFTTTTSTSSAVSTIVTEKQHQSLQNASNTLSCAQFENNTQELAHTNTRESQQRKQKTPVGNGTVETTEPPLGTTPTSTQPRKRSRTSPGKSASNNPKQTKLSNYWLGAPPNGNNRFSILDESDDEEEEKQPSKIIPKPPPIYITGVANIQPLRNLLNQIAGNEYQMKVLNTDEVKVQPKTEQMYSKLTKALNERNTQFHTYKLKSDKTFNVVLRGIHHSTPHEDIRVEIENLGHSVINVCNIKQRVTKKPLSLFWINLKQNSNNKDIYQVTGLLNTKIVFEPPRKKREIPQCTKCQRYNHTKKFCNHIPRCVKCAGEHHTLHCTQKNMGNNVKCVLCGENHPANYKGCTVYKQLQQKQYPALRLRQPPIDNTREATSSMHVPGRTYADAARHLQPNPQPTHNPQPIYNSEPPSTEGNLPTTDISELKEMMKMLMQQMSTMINLITALVNKP